MTIRTCQGCGYKFRSYGSETYCSQACAGNDAWLGVLRSLQKFAAEDAARRAAWSRRAV